MAARKEYDAALVELKSEVEAMCRLTEEMIEDAIRALKNRDPALGKEVGTRDRRVDEYEMDIEKRCMRLLVHQQPVARDFREISTALKVITDIERFGDQASDIGDIVYHFEGKDYIKEPIHIAKMGDLAISMVRRSVESFLKDDKALAAQVIAADDEMDELFLTVKRELTRLISIDAGFADQAIDLMMIAKYLERIGDHAVNVAEWAEYHATGVHVKY